MANKIYKQDHIKREYSTESGKDFRDTSVVSGEAMDNPGRNAVNTTDRYTTGPQPKDGLGGKASM